MELMDLIKEAQDNISLDQGKSQEEEQKGTQQEEEEKCTPEKVANLLDSVANDLQPDKTASAKGISKLLLGLGVSSGAAGAGGFFAGKKIEEKKRLPLLQKAFIAGGERTTPREQEAIKKLMQKAYTLGQQLVKNQ